MTMFKHAVRVLFLISAALAVAPQALACYTVYNRINQPVYSSMQPPIDMSYQIHERLPAVFPGGHMVFGNSTDCPSIDARITVTQSGESTAAATGNRATTRPRRASRN
jgi:hypothetical protein